MGVRRLLPIGLGITALLVLAGIASHGRPLSTGTGSGPTAGFFDYVATTFLLLGLAVAVVVVAALLTGNKPAAGAPRRSRRNLLSSLAMFFAACGIAYLLSNSQFQERLRKLEQQSQQQQQRPQGTLPHVKPSPGERRNARIRWDEVAVVLVLVAGIGVWLYLRREQRKPLRPLVLRRGAAVARALDDSLDDLRNDPDIRRAIIAAYARMERALAGAGIARRPAEAPYEYLARALAELDAGAGAARRLTDLFERAKFSHHEPAEAMRADAIASLEAVRDDIQAAA